MSIFVSEVTKQIKNFYKCKFLAFGLKANLRMKIIFLYPGIYKIIKLIGKDSGLVFDNKEVEQNPK